MKILKKIKIDMWINAIMTLIIGILFIARPQGAMEVTAIVAGAVIFANGLIDLIYYMNIWSELYIGNFYYYTFRNNINSVFVYIQYLYYNKWNHMSGDGSLYAEGIWI